MSRALVLSLLAPLALSACASKRGPMVTSQHEPMVAAELRDAEGTSHGLVTFTATDGGVLAMTSLHDLPRQSVHGLHVHEGRKCGEGDFSKAGGHFSPDGDPHGAPAAPGDSHAGDLGNIATGNNGIAIARIHRPDLSLLTGEDAVLGRTVILHAERDDLSSQPSGSAGDRLLCGVIVTRPTLAPQDYVGAR